MQIREQKLRKPDGQTGIQITGFGAMALDKAQFHERCELIACYPITEAGEHFEVSTTDGSLRLRFGAEDASVTGSVNWPSIRLL